MIGRSGHRHPPQAAGAVGKGNGRPFFNLNETRPRDQAGAGRNPESHKEEKHPPPPVRGGTGSLLLSNLRNLLRGFRTTDPRDQPFRMSPPLEL